MSNFYSFEYQDISTTLIENDSDARLLEKVKGLNFYKIGGWAIVAEILKRFERMTRDDRHKS